MSCSKDHNVVTPVRLEPAALRYRVNHSTTEPLRSPICQLLGPREAALQLSCDLETSPENRKENKNVENSRCDSLAAMRFVRRPCGCRMKLSKNVVVDKCTAAAQLV